MLNLPNDIFFGSVYIPTENKKYASKNCFLEIERELINLSRATEYVCLLVDFNTRVGKLQDYVIVDDYLANHNNWDEETREAVKRSSIHSDIHIKFDRNR